MQTSGATTAALVQQTLTLFADIDAYRHGSHEHYGANIQNKLNFGYVLSGLLQLLVTTCTQPKFIAWE